MIKVLEGIQDYISQLSIQPQKLTSADVPQARHLGQTSHETPSPILMTSRHAGGYKANYTPPSVWLMTASSRQKVGGVQQFIPVLTVVRYCNTVSPDVYCTDGHASQL